MQCICNKNKMPKTQLFVIFINKKMLIDIFLIILLLFKSLMLRSFGLAFSLLYLCLFIILQNSLICSIFDLKTKFY